MIKKYSDYCFTVHLKNELNTILEKYSFLDHTVKFFKTN